MTSGEAAESLLITQAGTILILPHIHSLSAVQLHSIVKTCFVFFLRSAWAQLFFVFLPMGLLSFHISKRLKSLSNLDCNERSIHAMRLHQVKREAAPAAAAAACFSDRSQSITYHYKAHTPIFRLFQGAEIREPRNQEASAFARLKHAADSIHWAATYYPELI